MVSNQKIGDHFQYLTIALPQKKEWIPGDKVQVKVNSTNLRSYTPIAFNNDQKTFTTLIYNHQKGPGSVWSEQVLANTKVEVLGPRKSLITNKKNKYVFIGDETTFGLVRALLDAGTHLEYFLKISNPNDISPICSLLNLKTSAFFENYELIYNQLSIDTNIHYILSGHKDVINGFELFLTNKGISPEHIIKKVYWFNKKL